MSLSGLVVLSGRFLLAMAACSLIAACGESPEPASGATPAASSKSAVKTGQLPPEMVAAVAAGKTTAALGVHFALKSEPVVGQPLQADIALVPHQVFESIQARFEPQEGMVISGGRELEPQKGIKAEQVISHRIVLEPRREGILMVTAAVETEGEEGSTVRIFSIPVIVHSQTPTANPAPAAGQQ
jgi:hypothetical protein